MASQRKRRPNRRTARTREAILAAFDRQIFASGYDTLSASAIAESASVSRSTFYAHFRNRDAVLAASVGHLFAELAEACLRPGNEDALARLCGHFWTQRALARTILTGRRGEIMVAVLAQKFYQALVARSPKQAKSVTRVSKSMAIYLASANLGLLQAWLTDRVPLSVEEVASILHSQSQGAASAMPALRGRRAVLG